MIDQLRAQYPTFGSLEESELVHQELSVGWQVTALNINNEPIGSGFHKDLLQARKIAIAEFIERSFVSSTRSGTDAAAWRLTDHPTTCGFAAGFDVTNTEFRSVCEAVERWALSCWVDMSCPIDETNEHSTARSTQILMSNFSTYRVFRKSFVYPTGSSILNLELCVLVAFTEKGAFLGSAVRGSFADAFEHAAIEAHRHLLIAGQARNFTRFPYNRIKYFAENRERAELTVDSPRATTWPQLKLEFQKSFNASPFFIVRTIFRDWTPWHEGPVDRMVY